MTPEQMTQRIDELERRLNLLTAAATIPYEVDQAFRKRLEGTISIVTTGKSATDESQTVQEGGSATYGVLKNPDIYLSTTVGGTLYYLPAFT